MDTIRAQIAKPKETPSLPAMAPEKMAAYVAHWRGRCDRDEQRCQAAAKQAMAEAYDIAVLLHQRYGVTQVLLFGSLVRGGFSTESDIDLAVAGLEKSDFYSALADANACARRWVDLKPLEALHPRFRRRIKETCIELLGIPGEDACAR